MTNVPLVQPLDLSRFAHYQLPESNDRSYRSTPQRSAGSGSGSGSGSGGSATPEGTPQTAHTTQSFGFSPPDGALSPAPHSAPHSAPPTTEHQQQHQQHQAQHQLLGGQSIQVHSHLTAPGPGGPGAPGGPPGGGGVGPGGHPQIVKMNSPRDQNTYWDSSMRPPPRDLAFQPQQPYPMYREYYDNYSPYSQYPLPQQTDQAEERRRRELQKARRHVW